MKKRILFVDDEPKFLGLYRVLFDSKDAAWEIALASSGPEALSRLETTPCDVLVAKWRLAGMTGSELLAQVAERQPEAARIVVAEMTDQEEVAQRLGARHQFLPRSLDPNALRSTIRRVCSIQNAALDEKISRLLADDYCVPSLPSLYFRILRAMESPDASLDEIGGIIAEDPAMTAKILQMVNSAFFGFARRISSPTEAAQMLGLQRVRSMALSVHTFSCFDPVRLKGFPLSQVWDHSIAASQIAQKICRAEKADKITTEEAQLACMLHDVGKVMLASSDPARYQEAIVHSRKRQTPLWEIETEVFGVSHAEVGSYLLGLWGLPIAVVEATALHHTPDRTAVESFTPLTVAHVASWLENEISGPAIDGPVAVIDGEYLTRLGLTERLDVWREAVEDIEVVAAGRGR